MTAYERGSLGRIRGEMKENARKAQEAARERKQTVQQSPIFFSCDDPQNDVIYEFLAPKHGAIVSPKLLLGTTFDGCSLKFTIENAHAKIERVVPIENGTPTLPERVDVTEGDKVSLLGTGVKNVLGSFFFETV